VSDLVMMPEGIIWNRIHSQQESVANRTNKFIPLKYDISLYKFLKKQQLVIDMELKKSVLRKTMMIIVKQTTRFVICLKFRVVLKILNEMKNDVETFS
jgi:hypothetical protein